MTVRTRNCYTEPFIFSIVPTLEEAFNEQSTTATTPKGKRCFAPALDVIEADNMYIVKLDVPGLSKDNLSLHFDEVGDLVISAKTATEDSNSIKYLHRERRSCFEFERRVKLGKDADQDGVEAKLADGVLEVRVKRSMPSKKTISIN